MALTTNGCMAIGRVGARLLDELCSMNFGRFQLGVYRLLKHSHIKVKLTNGVKV